MDVAALVGGVAAIGLSFVAPGITWGPLLAPGRQSGVAWMGRTIGAGITIAALIATVLVAAGRLQPGIAIACLAIATVAPLATSAARDELRGLARRQGRRAASLALAGVTLVTIGVHLAGSHAQLGPESLPATSTVWYYRHLAQLVESTGGLPALFPEWGGFRPFHTDYLPFTAHSAMTFGLMPGDAVLELEAYRLAVLAGTALVAALLFRRWLPAWIAVAGGLLLVTTQRMDWKLLSYKPETFGVLLGLFALWLVDRAAVERSARAATAAVLTFGLVVMSHAEVAIVLLPAALGIALARGIARPSAGPLRLSFSLRRGYAATGVALAVTGAGLIGGLLVNAGLTGHAGLLGYLDPDRDRAGSVVVDPALVPEGWELSEDPTWNFHTAAVARGQAGSAPPERFTDRRLLSRENLHVWTPVDGRTLVGAATLAALVLVPLAAWPWLDRRRRRLVIVGAVFAVGLLAGSVLLAELSATYVPRRIGPRRLVPYELLVPVGGAMLTLWALAGAVRRAVARSGRPISVTGRRLVMGAAFAAILGIPFVTGPSGGAEEESGGLSPAGANAYAWLRGNLPNDARVLANAYTDGSLTLLSGGLGILDGRAVYLEDPAFVSEATGLLLGARRFFAEPADPSSDSFLALADPDYLLVVTNPANSVDLGGYRPFVTDLAGLDADDRFEPVADLAHGRLRLYRVVAGSGGGG